MRPRLALSRLRRLLALPSARRALLMDGGWALLKATWQVRTWPFAHLAATLGTVASPSATVALQLPAPSDLPADLAWAGEVRWAISAWARVWPRQPTCLMQAVAARHLLAARGVPCETYFGVNRQSAAPGAQAQGIGAHAWLRCAGAIVTGDAEAANFQPIAVYRCTPSARSSPT